MNSLLTQIETAIYKPYGFKISAFKLEAESKEYTACNFLLNDKHIICRNAKITPKKVGQFVTFWKRNGDDPIAPFDETDSFDFYVVNVQNKATLGQFVFPKSILIKKGIISTNKKEGKRGFRVYPGWDTPTSKEAQRTQKWQLDYFYKVNNAMDLDKIKSLYV